MRLSRYRPSPAVRRLGILAASLVVLGAGTGMASTWAQAHVTVSAPGAVSGGGDQLISFRVPTESASASTVAIKIKLPIDTPIASVLVQPLSGWTAKATTSKLAKPITTDDGQITEAVTEIDWSATSAASAIKPGQFEQFVIIAGKLPAASSLTFKAVQTYSDGTTVSCIEVAAPGSSVQPDHPAPVLELGHASPSATPSAGPSATVSQDAPPTQPAAASAKSSSNGAATTGIVLGVVGILLGGAALVLGLRRRSPTA